MLIPLRLVLTRSGLRAPALKHLRARWARVVSGALCLAGLLHTTGARAQVSVSSLGAPVTENFNSLANSGTSSLLPTGWALLETGTNADTTYAAGTGSSTAGNTYSFGTTSAERAFGTLRSGSLIPTIGAQFVNDTGGPVSAIDIQYIGEEWRLGAAGRQDRLDFQYSLNATSLATGTWVDVDALDFATPVIAGAAGLKNGDDPTLRSLRQSTIAGLSIPAGAAFWIRWNDFDPAGSDDGLAIDDFALTATTTDAPSVLSTFPTAGTTGVGLNALLNVTFSEPVTLGPSWVDVTCSASGFHALVSSGGPTTFSVDASAAFAPGEQCTLSVFGPEVSDQDLPVAAMLADFTVSFTTAAASGCGTPAVAIHDIQGAGATSPLVGSVVSIEGVVVGDFQGSMGLSGFFVQARDADRDANPSTSEGIFVLDAAVGSPVAAGDVVRVTGSVAESFNLTELDNVTGVEVCGSGASVTLTELSLPVASATVLESSEGMLVRFLQPLTVSETFNLGRFGELLLSANGRLREPTNLVLPGSPAIALQAQNDLASIQLDDGSNVQDPAAPQYLAADGTLRIGDSVSGVVGALGFAFSTYEVHPTLPVAFTRTNPRQATPPNPGGTLRVAAFNVLNYFTTLDTGSPACGPLGTLGCRGANTANEFQRQRAKILAALSAINADVIGLLELENNSSASLTDLVNGLNGLLGAGTYDFINTGTIGTDAIKVGLLYKPARVERVGAFALLNSSVDPTFIDTLNRPVLAQTLRRRADGETFTVAVNHLKSKGSACAGDPDTGDGQANCNLTRLAAARAEVAWLAGDPTQSGDPDFLIIGDMNAYAQEDPIRAITSAGYSNLIASKVGPDAYSYVFDGQSGYLDHALASGTLAAKITGAGEWHINADEPHILDYNQEFNPPSLYHPDAFRASDHDPLLVGIGSSAAVPLPRSAGAGLAAALLGLGIVVLRLQRSRAAAK